ncbi:hypothetical protein KKG83_00125 [Candidatus Micrarchaeota archaeon]|nr:hypothetical protein [Candidatus Micrarchaeota archaeon]MBU2475858.1 hypothetical protein [Candidatus Micrarchaeota archaeon]
MPRGKPGRKDQTRTSLKVKETKKNKTRLRRPSPRQILKAKFLERYNEISAFSDKLERVVVNIFIRKQPPSRMQVTAVNASFKRLHTVCSEFYDDLLRNENVLGKRGVLYFVHSLHHYTEQSARIQRSIMRKWPRRGMLSPFRLENLANKMRKYGS